MESSTLAEQPSRKSGRTNNEGDPHAVCRTCESKESQMRIDEDVKKRDDYRLEQDCCNETNIEGSYVRIKD